MKVRYLPDPNAYVRMNTRELRKAFLVKKLFKQDEITLLYTDADRSIIGSAVPVKKHLVLKSSQQEMATEYFAERREVGIINIGGSGKILVDETKYQMDYHDTLHIGRGLWEIKFLSNEPLNPAVYYILSYPAHTSYPVKHLKFKDGDFSSLGSAEQANERTITKLIFPGGLESCQLVMGITELQPGSVWNTMGAHIHPRRTEIYMYYNLGKDERLFHFFGKPAETRHLVMKNRQAVISPSWSMHSGAGTCNYSFIWGMGGENQTFDDMDFIAMDQLR